MRESKFVIIEQTMNNPKDYGEGYTLEILTEAKNSVQEAFDYCKEIAESTSRTLNMSGDYNTIVIGDKVVDADTNRIIAVYYIQPTTIETFI